MNDNKKETVNDIIGFQEEIANIQTAIADFECGHNLNIAIIAEPFVGKTTLVNEIKKINPEKVTRISFSSTVKYKENIKILEKSKRIVIIDDCNFLYERKIGGFETLEFFLRSAVSSSNIFITTWNLYSWNYLDEVIKIGHYFPIQIKLLKLTKDQIKEFILSKYEEKEIKFEEDVAFEKEKVLEPRKFTILLKDFPFYRRLRAKAYVNDLRYEFEFESEVTRRAWDELSKNGVEATNLNIFSDGNIGQAK